MTHAPTNIQDRGTTGKRSRLPQRAATYDELKPLLALCKAGKLFEVQAWIKEGKPVNPPPLPTKGAIPKSPLRYAIELGFHSLVDVLLSGGAIIDPDDYRSPMNLALGMRRLDMAQLLVEHGYDPASVDMDEVFQTWDPQIMEYFIERGADVEEGGPLASALISRIRTTIGIFKRYGDRFPTFQEQANTALRYHCYNGNVKWASLLLYAGADPYAPGGLDPGDCSDSNGVGFSAVKWAAISGNIEILKLRKIRLDPQNSVTKDVARSLCSAKGEALLRKLLDQGLDPNDQGNGGSSMISSLLHSMAWKFERDNGTTGLRWFITDSRSRADLRLLHLIVKCGAKWIPERDHQIADARKSLRKLPVDYAVEFVWLMSKYGACSRETIVDLLKTPTMKLHVKSHANRINEILMGWP